MAVRLPVKARTAARLKVSGMLDANKAAVLVGTMSSLSFVVLMTFIVYTCAQGYKLSSDGASCLKL